MKNMSTHFLVYLFLIISCTAKATVRYVKTTAGGTGSGNSWANASSNLQAMINASSPGDQVWVASGTYKPTTTTDMSISFSMKDGVGIYGGFNGSETLLSQRNWTTNPTILSGDIGIAGNIFDNCYHVVYNYNNGLTATAVLNGFTLTGGNATNVFNLNNHGGGMLNYNCSPSITNCNFLNNSSSNIGAGMSNVNANTVITNCIFANNSANFGYRGGLYNTGNASNNVTVINSLFVGNVATYGGGLYADVAGTTSLINCTVTGNSAPNGAGIITTTTLTLSNCIIWDNGTSEISNIGSGNTINVNHSIVKGGYTGTGNLNQNPLFLNAADANGTDNIFGTEDDGLHVFSTSPAINASNPATTSPLTDLIGKPRVGVFDLGAYEYIFPCPAMNTSNASNATACYSYTWALNNNTYTLSGAYTTTSTNAYWCTHTDTLHLTIDASTVNTTQVVACNSYTWPVNGQTYTASGVYTNSVTPTFYCASSSFLSCQTYITNVTIGSINNSSGCNGFGYSDFTSISTTVVVGSSYPISISVANPLGVYNEIKVWIDWNHDGDFDDIDEGSPLNPNSIMVPLNASIGNTRMRVRLIGNETMLPCGLSSFGDVEDYTISVSGSITAPCPPIEVLNLTINTPTINTTQITACNSYIWPVNGQTYTSSGVYTYTLAPTYCIPSTSILCAPQYNIFISLVSIGAINNSSACGLVSGYSDFTSLSTPVIAGNSYPFSNSIFNSIGYYGEIKVWIDWNQDGDFDDGGEASPVNPNNITVPLNAHNGNTRMRVRLYTNVATLAPCGTLAFGESEDYTLIVSGGLNQCLPIDLLNLTIAPSTITNLADATALRFDGQNDYVSAGNPTQINFERTNTFTLEAWFKTITPSPEEPILSKMLNTSPYRGYELFITSTGNIGFYLINTFPSNYIRIETQAGNFNNEEWHHVAVSYNGSSNASGLTIYVDGIIQPLNIISNNLSSSILTTAELRIGARTSPTYLFTGVLDEVRCWNTVRTASEIIANLHCSVSCNQNGLVANYNFNEGKAGGINTNVTTLFDYSQNALHATLHNFYLDGASSNWIASNNNALSGICGGQEASALNFDGVNDYVSLGNLPSINFEKTNMFTLESWIKTATTTSEKPIISKMINSSPFRGYELLMTSDGKIGLYLINNYPSNYIRVETQANNFNNNQWHHIAVSYNGNSNASGIAIYVDGFMQPVNVIANSLNDTITTTAELRLGVRTSSTNYFNGSIDEVRIWNTVRTTSEIMDYKNCSLVGNENGLLASYNFKQGVAGSCNPGIIELKNNASDCMRGYLNNFALSGSTSNWVNGANGVNSNCISEPLSLKLFIEGYWNGSNSMKPVLHNQGLPNNITDCDSIIVELHPSTSPFTTTYSNTTILNINGTANVKLPASISGSYYIVVKHRNGLQTWSALPVVMTNQTSYDFSTAANKAFGNNQAEVASGVWALYSGDLIIDENIDLLDLGILEVEINNFSFGYNATDMNGDGNVDLLDVLIMEDNVNSFIISNHP